MNSDQHYNVGRYDPNFANENAMCLFFAVEIGRPPGKKKIYTHTYPYVNVFLLFENSVPCGWEIVFSWGNIGILVVGYDGRKTFFTFKFKISDILVDDI